MGDIKKLNYNNVKINFNKTTTSTTKLNYVSVTDNTPDFELDYSNSNLGNPLPEATVDITNPKYSNLSNVSSNTSNSNNNQKTAMPTITTSTGTHDPNVRGITDEQLQPISDGLNSIVSTIVASDIALKNGIYNAGETLIDGAFSLVGVPFVHGVSAIGDAILGTNDADQHVHDLQNLIATNIVDEATKEFYKYTPFGAYIDHYSLIKYDDVIFNNIKLVGRAGGDMGIIIGSGILLGPAGSAASVGLLTMGSDYSNKYKVLSNNGERFLTSDEQVGMYAASLGKGIFAGGVTYFGGGALGGVTSLGQAVRIGATNAELVWSSGTVVDSFYYGDVAQAFDKNGGIASMVAFPIFGGLAAGLNYGTIPKLATKLNSSESVRDSLVPDDLSVFDVEGVDFTPKSADNIDKEIASRICKSIDGTIERSGRSVSKKPEVKTFFDNLYNELSVQTINNTSVSHTRVI
ncbi:MAG: hypothetical protein IKJ43_01440 [Bacilli bacterium]|nr:hypothetical protein [Bacilli bacterium]